jgi:hypothetical protein
VLKKSSSQGRALLLCYPDEVESMAAACLDVFTGDTIIHIGEMITTGTAAGAPVAPFGRTSSAEFQVTLAETFHCVLVAELAVRFPISRDCISVWKRTRFVAGADTGADPAASIGSSQIKPKTKTNKDAKSTSSAGAGAVEFVSPADLALLREAALDIQYSEEQDNHWMIVPEDEVLPVDRAAPSLLYLLAACPSPSRT